MATTPMPAGYQSTTDPRQLASNQRQLLYGQGGQLQNQFGQYGQANQGGANPNTVSGTADYLNQIESPLAQGQGGYNANEASQIELSPQDKQNIISGAGISAGQNTAASVGAADRAAAASGGNPLALAAYRARAAQQQGSQAGNAMTQARIGAQQAGSAGAQAVGNARLGQQNQGLNYYQGQNTQANQNVNLSNALQEQNYGTQGGLTNQASGIGLQASQTPSTFDKILGGIGGALSFLDEGDVASKGTPAVVGENGPEKVVNLAETNVPSNSAAYLDDGDIVSAPPSLATLPHSADYNDMQANAQGAGSGASQPWWKRFQAALASRTAQPQAQQQPWTPVTPYQQMGQMGGNVANLLHLEDGGIASGNGKNGIFTEPTRVNLDPGEAVVPLGYRAHAKTRPSMAALPAAKQRRPYGAAA